MMVRVTNPFTATEVIVDWCVQNHTLPRTAPEKPGWQQDSLHRRLFKQSP